MDTPASSEVNRYCGEAAPSYPGARKWHPLIYHCPDVAAVGLECLERAPTKWRLFAQASQLFSPLGNGS